VALLEEVLFTKLSGTTAITDIVGKRIYPQLAPDKVAKPYIVYQRISGPREQIMGGKSGVAYPRIQITCWASTYTAVKALAEVVRLALEAAINTTWGTVSILACVFEGDTDIEELSEQTEAARAYGVALDFTVWHTEATS
jgi:hypothetical protein